MPRSRIEIYWKRIETAPAGVAVQVRVTDGSDHDYLLPYPCKLMEGTWVNAASGTPLAVRPTYWKLYVESVETQTACRAVLAGDRAWGLPVLARARGRCGCRLRGLPASQAGRLPGPDELSNISKSR